MTFRKIPSAIGLTLQLPTAHAGRWNFPKSHPPNLATERKKRSVLQFGKVKIFSCYLESQYLSGIAVATFIWMGIYISCTWFGNGANDLPGL